MDENQSVVITIETDPGEAIVQLFIDGSATVDFDCVTVARREISGGVCITAAGEVDWDNLGDSYSGNPLVPRVHAAVLNRARKLLRRARRQAREVLRAHASTRRVAGHE